MYEIFKKTSVVSETLIMCVSKRVDSNREASRAAVAVMVTEQ